MLAWRTASSAQRTLVNGERSLETGSDDDGERYGGKRLLGVLSSMKVEGSVVVARWYGGVMLGPVRFTHIENCAREAVSAWQQHQAAAEMEKRKVEEEQRERTRLIAELQDRDESILSLRTLLNTKTMSEHDTSGSQKTTTAASPASKGIDYKALPLQRLRMLDKARDSTIAFLLKQLDAVDKKTQTSTPGDPIGQAT